MPIHIEIQNVRLGLLPACSEIQAQSNDGGILQRLQGERKPAETVTCISYRQMQYLFHQQV